MDPKELRANAPLSISVNDDSTKYAHNSSALATNQSKSYHETGSTAMGKMDVAAARPCAIIGPDRVLPQNPADVYLKKTPVEAWPCTESTYRQLPDYPSRLSDYPPIRNISPRQTFQENMQRIMVPPTYSSIKSSDDSNLKNAKLNNKLNMPQEAKYCDVPYNMNTNELKSVKNSDIPMSSVNPAFGRSVPHYGWPAGVNIRPPRPDIYQYPEYSNCGPRPVTISHPHRLQHEEAAQLYSERLYQEANIRFKPYPILKEKHQPARYDYLNNYQNTFHPPVAFPPHKYDLQKSLQTHPYPMYPQVPLKYLDRRVHEPFIDGYQRSNQQPNFNTQFHNQVIHPQYGPISGNCVQNKSFTDSPSKSIVPNKLPYETNNKIYLELDTRNKSYPMPENVYYNDTNHSSHIRGEILLPNRPALNMHSMPQHQIFRRDNLPLKHYDYNPHYRNLDPSLHLNYPLPRLPLQYSPNTIAISPSDSNASNDTTHTLAASQEDCGYVSQSSTNSVRSLDAANVSASKDIYRRHEYNFHAMSRKVNGSDKILKSKNNSSSKKNIDVRQFLQMWNEGEDETNEPNKEVIPQINPNNCSAPSKSVDNQEQLYVLGLVNVPSEELGKYEHIQKISKLPENIKGYNSIELLNQYEELLESPNNSNYKAVAKVHKDYSSVSKRPNDKEHNTLLRPVSPLDVEAKISQSVIHKEVGCNFEIKPCSPEMLNAEIATPIQSILGERIIEKVVNPMTSKSPLLTRSDGIKINNANINNNKNASCDIINKQYPINNYSNITKNNDYTVHDFESNSGISLASLPRLDNDIELNFPEINQQFIKANKIEPDAHLFQKDLAQVNLNQIASEKNSFQQQTSLSPQCSLISPPEKEFSKLSKYRISKKCNAIPKDEIPEKNNNIAQQRINSVIIKNPDTKLQEETDVSFSTLNPGHNNIHPSLKPDNSDDNISFDTAIDFSFSKNEGVSYGTLIESGEKAHALCNSPENIVSEKIKTKEPTEYNLGQIKDYKSESEENVGLEPLELIENSHLTVSDLSVTCNLTVNDLNKESTVPVIKNVSIITEFEESANTQKNNTCLRKTIQQEKALLKISSLPESDKEIKNDDEPDVPTTLKSKVDICLDKELNNKKEDFKNIVINQSLETYENDKIYNNSEVNDKFSEIKEIPNSIELFTVGEENTSLNTSIENTAIDTTLSDLPANKIEENDENQAVKEDAANLIVSLDSTKPENVKKNMKLIKYTESLPTDGLTLHNQLKDMNKTSENSCEFNNVVDPDINDYSFNACNQESKKNYAESAMSSCSKGNSDVEKNKFFDVEMSSENSTIEIPEDVQNRNCDSDEIICSNKHNKNLKVKNNLSTVNYFNENKKITDTDIVLNTTFTISNKSNVSSNSDKYVHISKELYSPWVQKLIIFKEGICGNVKINAFGIEEEKLTHVDIPGRTEDKDINLDHKKLNTSDIQNSLMCSENRENENLNGDSHELTKNNESYENLTIKETNVSEYNKKCLVEENHATTSEYIPFIRRNVLKRSLSETALEDYKDEVNMDVIAPSKRKKRNHNIIHPVISEDLCGIIQTNRRNSVSTFYNEENVYILIDNDLIIAEENDDTGKMFYTEMPQDFVDDTPSNDCTVDNTITDVTEDMNSVELDVICEERSVDDTWVEDVACIETVVSDDVTDDIHYDVTLPKKCNLGDESINDQSAIFCDNEHIDKIKNTYGNNMCIKDTQILQTLYMTPQMNVNKTLLDIESHSEKYQEYNDTVDQSVDENECDDQFQNEIFSYSNCEIIIEKENIIAKDTELTTINENEEFKDDVYVTNAFDTEEEKCTVHSAAFDLDKDYVLESSKKTTSNYSNSSSPEVSSTTPEEKNSSILLKITNHNGSRISKVNEVGSLERLSYKLTEKMDYQSYNSNFGSSRTLITKAAQKYIPPLKESIRDLKIKLSLPQHRLHTLKQLKISKVEPKIDDNIIKYINKSLKHDIPKKPKPKFEDVLKSIDEIQFQKCRDKTRKGKNVIPKVVIKKNENGAHFASCRTTSDNETYNPDLTGRKWQPWVFLEKNNFIDKMAIKNKVKAVYCHRKNNYVLAENFRKYKSIYNANFVISQPSPGNSAKGTLKYTIKLKHK